MDTLASNLRQWRKLRRYTQQQMADFLSVHRSTYTKYESGTVDLSLESLCRLADVLGCTTDALLGRE